MNSRMERYKSEEDSIQEEMQAPVSSRVRRNNSLYNDIKTNELSRVTNNDNIKVIENNGKTIDLEKIKRYICEINDQPKQNNRRSVTLDDTSSININKKEEKTPKDYDINSVLERAKQTREIDYDRERYKKLRNTEYDILSKIEMYDNKEEELLENLSESFNTEERTVIDLINTVTIHKGDVNLLEELMGDDEEEKLEPINKELEKGKIQDEISKVIEETKEEKQDSKQTEMLEKTQNLTDIKEKNKNLDNSFFTNSITFGKEDFEGFEELEKSVKKSSLVTTLLMIILIIAIVVTLVIMANYVFNLGLF